MKELLKRKTTKIGIAVIILAVAISIIGINARSAQRQRAYDGHIEAAQKYLTELDYEQAIAEYTLALEIEPNAEEALNALEHTYLDYAQSLADAGDYEKAVSVLEEGYAQTGRESLREKMEELKSIQEHIVEFPFELTDITIRGYDLFDDYFEEICMAYGCPVDQDLTEMSYGPDSSVHNEYGYLHSSVIEGFKDLVFYYNENVSSSETYMVAKEGDMFLRVDMDFDETSYIASDLEFYGINVPVEPGSSYEEWNRIMQVQKIKEKGEQYEDETETVWFFQTKWGRGAYRERESGVELDISFQEQTEGDGRDNWSFKIDRVVFDGAIHYGYHFMIDNREAK